MLPQLGSKPQATLRTYERHVYDHGVHERLEKEKQFRVKYLHPSPSQLLTLHSSDWEMTFNLFIFQSH